MLEITEEQVLEAICWSADVDDKETLLRHLRRMPRLRRVKIDRLFLDRGNPMIVSQLKDEFPDLKVLLDTKYVEIPSKLEELAKVGCRHRPWMLNCMAGGVSTELVEPTEHDKVDDIDGLRRFADVCLEVEVRPCAVSVLTTKSPAAVLSEFRRGRVKQVLYYADLVLRAGFTDLVCSPQELIELRRREEFNGLNLVTPGIRPAGSAKNDQVNAKTPRGALEAGSNVLVIGRPIHADGDPAENFDNIVAEILSAA